LERLEHLERRKEIYEALYPNAKPEIQRLRGMVNLKPFASGDDTVSPPERVPTFTEDTATKTGRHQRSVQRDVNTISNIPKNVREIIRYTPLADAKRELIELARKPEEEQREIAA